MTEQHAAISQRERFIIAIEEAATMAARRSANAPRIFDWEFTSDGATSQIKYTDRTDDKVYGLRYAPPFTEADTLQALLRNAVTRAGAAMLRVGPDGKIACGIPRHAIEQARRQAGEEQEVHHG
jgi:hypothetical protein